MCLNSNYITYNIVASMVIEILHCKKIDSGSFFLIRVNYQFVTKKK